MRTKSVHEVSLFLKHETAHIMESAQKLLVDLFTTGNPQPIYEAFLDQDQIDAEVLSSIVQKIKKDKGDFASVDEVTERNADNTKFTGSINLANGTVKFEVEIRGNKIRNLSFGLGQEPESISSKIITARGVEYITLFFTRNAGARALMSEIFCEVLPMPKFIHDMHMETSRIGFGKFTSAKADVTDETLVLDNTSGTPSVTVNFVVEFESATTTADVTFGVTGLRAEITGFTFASSITRGGKMTEGQGKQQAALVLQTLFNKKINEFLNGSLHRDLLSMFDAKILEWHVNDLADSIGAFKAPIDEQKIGFEEDINGDQVIVMGRVSATNSDLVFTFEWNKCIMSAFNWAAEDKSAYVRSTLDINRAYFETKTTAFLDALKSSWMGCADDDIMPDLRNGDEMNRKLLDLRDLLDLDKVLEIEYEGNPEVFTVNGFERIVAIQTKVKLGDRVLEGTVKWFVDQLRAYIMDFEFTKTAEDNAAPIDIDDILAGLSRPAKSEDKWEKMKNFDFNWDD